MALFSNQFHKLRAKRLAESTKDFFARGKSVVRCELCQMANYACLCPFRPTLKSRCDFILLMHRNEVFKPTNSGRLVADILPEQTHVFCWSRTQPDPRLADLLADQNRQCFIVFPADAAQTAAHSHPVITELPENSKTATFILLDGTWKQSGRMFHLSQWLNGIPCITLPATLTGSYSVRKSHQENYLSTAEAAALCLEKAGEQNNRDILLEYFQLFNEHYLATRGCYPPEVTSTHHYLQNFTQMTVG